MTKKPEETNLLTTAAKVLGKTAGKIATLAGAAAEPPAQPLSARPAKGRLPKKNKTRLPRRQKKAQKKAKSSR